MNNITQTKYSLSDWPKLPRWDEQYSGSQVTDYFLNDYRRNREKLLVTSYKNLDADGLSSSFAFAEWLNRIGITEAKPCHIGDPQPEAAWLIDQLQYKTLVLIK